MAFDYMTPDPTNGITFRIFRDRDSAQRFYDKLSIFNAPGFITPGGNSIATVHKATYTPTHPEKSGFKEGKCEAYVDPQAQYALTAHCAALCSDVPVIVSGVRIQSKQDVEMSNGQVTYTLTEEEINAVEAIALDLLLVGMDRVMLLLVLPRTR